jgi:hypothetical protein
MVPSVLAFPLPPHAVAEASPHAAIATRDDAAGRPAFRARLRNDAVATRAATARCNLPKVLSLATDCRDLAFKMHEVRAARICDEVMFRSGYRIGDARSMVDADYWWQQHGFSGADKTSKAYSAFQKADLARLLDTVPVFSAKVVGGSSVLKYRRRVEFAGRLSARPLASRRPTVAATINDKPVTVMVDTGTVLPIMMDQAHATALGATPLLGEWVAPGMEKHPLPGARRFSTDLIANFKFGDLVMHNVATAVVPDGTFHVGVLIGLPVLARFGRVDLNDVRIAMGKAVPRCTSGGSISRSRLCASAQDLQ